MKQIQKGSSQIPQAPVTPSQNSTSYGCRLPPIDTEVFSGDYLRWPTSRDLFTAIYIDNPSLTPVEELFHLNSKTRGEAYSIVSRSPLTNDGFRSAWNNLTERFENKRLQVNSHLKTLFNVQSIANSMTKLLKRTLSFYGSSPSKNKDEIPTWLELDSYLMERHRTLEAVDSFRTANFHHVQSKDKNRVAEFRKINSFNTRLVPIPNGCDLCSKKNHPVRLCPRFLQMTVVDCLAYIQRNQLCSNCFASSHQFRDCTSAHNCLTCQNRHHTLLHRNSGPTTPPTTSDLPRPVSASVPHIISSYSAQVSVQKVPPKNTPSEYCVQYPALDGRRVPVTLEEEAYPVKLD